jgi:hypothetical protein
LKAKYEWYLKIKSRVQSQEQEQNNSTNDRLQYLVSRKKQLQSILHDFQNDFKVKNGHAIQNQKDMEPMAKEYKEYKVIMM